MRFDVYGRFRVDIERRDGAGVAYRVGAGTRSPMPDLVVPADVAADKLEDDLNDLLHEPATPDREIRRAGRGAAARYNRASRSIPRLRR